MKKESPQSAGGKARAAKLSPEERSKIARQAANQLWRDKPKSNKVTVACKVDGTALRRALIKSGLSKSSLIEKLITDYAGLELPR